jgi:Ca2+-transporting ATPase
MPDDNERQPLLDGGNNAHREQFKFGVDAEKLAELMDPKNPSLLRELGGVEGVCKKLKVDPSQGLLADEDKDRSTSTAFQKRKDAFGCNILPEASSKTFLELLWAAYNDKTLSKWRGKSVIGCHGN